MLITEDYFWKHANITTKLKQKLFIQLNLWPYFQHRSNIAMLTDLEIECYVVSSTINLIYGFIRTNVRATSYLPKQTKLTSI